MARVFRGYQIQEKIGSGGMSVIRMGLQISLEQKVAIKILHPALAHDENFIARFEREAKAASALRGHRNIVSIYDFGSDEDAYYIVMEFVDGADLRSVMREHGLFPPEIALILLEEISYGLEAAHEKGIVHRDIKPSNVLLGRDGSVKIADFGLARSASDIERTSALTLPGSVMGTPAYMSPEQVEGESVDGRSDIFSLGVLAFEFLVGEKPFNGSVADTREKILHEAAPSLHRPDIALPPEIESLVQAMLVKDASARIADLGEVVRQLQDCMEALDPSGELLKTRRRLLTEFGRDPAKTSRDLWGRRVRRHLERARACVPLEEPGAPGASDLGRRKAATVAAIEELRAVLRIDPQQKDARAELRRIAALDTSPEMTRLAADAVTDADRRSDQTDPARTDVTSLIPPWSGPSGLSPGMQSPVDGDDEDQRGSGASAEGTSVPAARDVEANPESGAGTAAVVGAGAGAGAASAAATGAAAGAAAGTIAATEVIARHPLSSSVHSESTTPTGRPPRQTRKLAGWIAVASVGVVVLVLLLFGVQRLRAPASTSAQAQGEIAAKSDVDSDENGSTGAHPDAETNVGADGQRTEDEVKGTQGHETLGDETGSEPQDSAGQGTSTEGHNTAGDETGANAQGTSGEEAGGKEADGSTHPAQSGAELTDTDPLANSKAYIRVDLDPPGDVLAGGRVIAQRTRRAIVEVPRGSVRDIVARHPDLGEYRWSGVAAKPDTTEISHTFPWSEIVLRWTPPGSGTVYLDRVLSGTRESVRQIVAPGTHRIGVSRRGLRLRHARHQAGAEAGTVLDADPGWNARMETFLVETKLRRSTEVVFEFEPE